VRVLQYPQSQSGTFPARSLSQDGLWGTAIGFQERLVLARNLVWRFKLPCGLEGNAPWLTHRKIAVSRKYGYSIENDNHLDRDFLVQLWVADRKMKNSRGKRRRKLVKYEKFPGTAYENQRQYGRWYSGAPLAEQDFLDKGKPVLNQPPLSQSDSAFLEPESPEEAQVALLLARSNLLITRDIEWANLMLGFEQENRYAIVDVCYPQSPVGFIREQSNLLARQIFTDAGQYVIRFGSSDPGSKTGPATMIQELEVARPLTLSERAVAVALAISLDNDYFSRHGGCWGVVLLLRTRRPFVAYITDGMGNELFRVRRPFWWITSSIYAEIDGKEIGVVHRRWHLWRRIYDLYLGNKQFAVVENPGFWNWTFTLKDIDGKVLAEIDRDWRGFGFE
ncbi:altered inheritance rate of mitochondria protein 25, partial [Quercus suber]